MRTVLVNFILALALKKDSGTNFTLVGALLVVWLIMVSIAGSYRQTFTERFRSWVGHGIVESILEEIEERAAECDEQSLPCYENVSACNAASSVIFNSVIIFNLVVFGIASNAINIILQGVFAFFFLDKWFGLVITIIGSLAVVVAFLDSPSLDENNGPWTVDHMEDVLAGNYKAATPETLQYALQDASQREQLHRSNRAASCQKKVSYFFYVPAMLLTVGILIIIYKHFKNPDTGKGAMAALVALLGMTVGTADSVLDTGKSLCLAKIRADASRDSLNELLQRVEDCPQTNTIANQSVMVNVASAAQLDARTLEGLDATSLAEQVGFSKERFENPALEPHLLCGRAGSRLERSQRESFQAILDDLRTKTVA